MGSFQPSVLSKLWRPSMLRVRAAAVSVLHLDELAELSAYHLTSTLMTLSFTRGASISSCTAAASNGAWRHVAWMVGCCFRQLCLNRSCIKSLPLGAAKAVVAAFVTSRVARCNSLLAGVARLGASWTDSSRCLLPRRGSSATGGKMTTSHRSSVMFSIGYQSDS